MSANVCQCRTMSDTVCQCRPMVLQNVVPLHRQWKSLTSMFNLLKIKNLCQYYSKLIWTTIPQSQAYGKYYGKVVATIRWTHLRQTTVPASAGPSAWCRGLCRSTPSCSPHTRREPEMLIRIPGSPYPFNPCNPLLLFYHKFWIIPRPIPVNFSICLMEAPFFSNCLMVFKRSSFGKALNSAQFVAVVINRTILSTCVSVGFGALYSFGSKHFVSSGNGLLRNSRHCSLVSGRQVSGFSHTVMNNITAMIVKIVFNTFSIFILYWFYLGLFVEIKYNLLSAWLKTN